MKVSELLRDWDEDRNGSVDRKEFAMMMPALGLRASKEDIDVVFALIDSSADGQISQEELQKVLAKQARVMARRAERVARKGERRAHPTATGSSRSVSMLQTSYHQPSDSPPQHTTSLPALVGVRRRAEWDSCSVVASGRHQRRTDAARERAAKAAAPEERGEGGGTFITASTTSVSGRSMTGSSSLPQLPGAIREKPVSFSKGERPVPFRGKAGPGPGAYEGTNQGVASRRVRGNHTFGNQRQGQAITDSVVRLLKDQNDKIGCALSRLDDLENRILQMTRQQLMAGADKVSLPPIGAPAPAPAEA